MSDFKLYFQNIHYNVIKPNFVLKLGLVTLELFYKIAINFKNFLYDKSILKEKKVDIYTICVGNLTTGGVGKTPIVQHLANLYSDKKVAIISRGYSSKLNNKVPNVIKDENKIYYDDGTIVGDEILQLCQNTPKNTVVITCQNRLLALELAKNKYNCKIAIMDDGFSNRKFKKD
ncbi:tetraacyldisaccharide 4'-kinase, partial [bacterium]|nr:tetraacyldisaccharide 4'-kinase [bacterium]